MHLAPTEQAGAMVFESTGYTLHLGPLAIRLPGLLSPGATRVTQRDLGDGTFEFDLTIDHPWFGRLTSQRGRFQSIGEPT